MRLYEVDGTLFWNNGASGAYARVASGRIVLVDVKTHDIWPGPPIGFPGPNDEVIKLTPRDPLGRILDTVTLVFDRFTP